MPSIFVDESNKITIKVAIGSGKNDEVLADISVKELKETYEDLDESSIREFEVICKQPSFKDSVALSKNLLSISNADAIDYNPLAARYAKMVNLIESWTLTDDEGNKVSPSEGNISRLHPVIANMIGLQLDAQTPTG